jgi:hypothetical protein
MFDRLISLLYTDPRDVIEVMAFPKSDPDTRIIGHYRPGSKLIRTLEDFDGNPEGELYDLYVGLNPVLLPLRPLCGTSSRAKESQVPNYRHFLIDGDPIRDFIRDDNGEPILFPEVRANGTPVLDKEGKPKLKTKRHKIATEEEWQLTRDDMQKAYDFLHERGVERAPMFSSGNGVHITPRVDLPNTHGNKEMIAGVQRLISERFSTIHTDIQSFCDANRVTRAYGSMNRKGSPPSPDRQHRRSFIIHEQ